MRAVHALETAIARCLGSAVLVAIAAFASVAANAAPVRIVAVGASNTHGWYVGSTKPKGSRARSTSRTLASATRSGALCIRDATEFGPKLDIRPSFRTGHFNVACLSGAATLLTLDDFACLARIDAPGSLPVPA